MNYDFEKPFVELTKTYNPVDYPKYDNYDAIEVSKVTTIAIGILKKSRCKEGNMSKKSNIKEDKDWTVADMVEYVITGKKPKV